MKRNVIVFGLISGLIISTFMVVSIAFCYSRDNFQGSMVVGYAAMIMAFTLIFVGIKNFRDKYNNGVVSFGKAFKIGLYIALISSSVYVAAWLIDYYFFIPDFMERYADHIVKVARTSGESAAEINKKMTEMESYKSMYKNPLFCDIADLW